jgi:hypothetical protein
LNGRQGIRKSTPIDKELELAVQQQDGANAAIYANGVINVELLERLIATVLKRDRIEEAKQSREDRLLTMVHTVINGLNLKNKIK